jgi:hypothetical protein
VRLLKQQISAGVRLCDKERIKTPEKCVLAPEIETFKLSNIRNNACHENVFVRRRAFLTFVLREL